MYATIVRQVLHEYYLSYTATMIPADKRFVKLQYAGLKQQHETTRFYFASTVFGLPMGELTPLLVLPFLIALLLAWLLSKVTFENKPHDANLSILNAGTAKMVTRMLNLNNSKTVIGSSKQADMTIAGKLTKVKEKHATVLYDKKNNSYTLVCDGDLKVNNKATKVRVLESGDVIDVDGTSIVFDDGLVK